MWPPPVFSLTSAIVAALGRANSAAEALRLVIARSRSQPDLGLLTVIERQAEIAEIRERPRDRIPYRPLNALSSASSIGRADFARLL